MPASDTLVMSMKTGRFLPRWLQVPVLMVKGTVVGLLCWLADADGAPSWALIRNRAGALQARSSLGRDLNEALGTYELMVRDLELLSEQEFLDKWAD